MTYYYIPKQARYWKTRSIAALPAAWVATTSKRDVTYTDADCISKSLIKYYFQLPPDAAPWTIVAFELDDVTECKSREELERARAAAEALR